MIKAAVLFLLIGYFGNVSLQPAEKFALEMVNDVKNCIANPVIDVSEFKIILKEKQISLDGKIKVTKTITGPIKLNIIIEKKKDDVWQSIVNETTPDVCKMLQNISSREPLAQLFTPEQRKCPIQMGDIPFNQVKLPEVDRISEQDFGEYRWNIQVTGLVDSKEEAVACVEGSMKVSGN